jgi:Na+/H+-dicarboxylate symporter
MLIIKPLNDLSVYLSHLVQGKLWLKVIIGMLLGAGVGILVNPSFGWLNSDQSQTLANWLNLPGEIFMKLVQMVMIPLIFTSIITGLVSNVTDNLKSFGLKLLAYFLFTTVVAILIGVFFALVFEPGVYFGKLGSFVEAGSPQVTPKGEVTLNIPQSISNLIPVNPLESFLTGEMLSVVIFTIIIGIAITQLDGGMSRPLIRFVEAIQKICMIVVGWAMRLVPYAVFGLIAALLSSTGAAIFLGLGYYMMVVILGLFVLLMFYMLVYFLFTRKNPLSFLKTIKDAQLLAFSTASSAAVMPLSMKVADEQLGVSSRVSNFVIPIGATINMDGTALFQCITVLFMAQVYGIELAPFDIILIIVTVVSASIGTPAIPGGGVIILTTVLSSSGIPADGLLIIIGIDRILGMFRTAVNVTGDLTATAIFNRWFG